ncbi:branched-chain amino acid ABC transporter permease [Blastococcus goldschmidtiae]|uniref:Branched-chain amino acid ABC transporter permease n=1 Tax=Blastococcus goldschmidtiae TaxID=3075546 RepID=A0ABU2K7M7_9ACTN|nr:branched-chain amino acid ABC transporter permease [Blastococcus sp. DSM 46792]MDT0276204.1 branched-chain amino acid ABC transporter permease [Blastococcus sp. DSM 46792]
MTAGPGTGSGTSAPATPSGHGTVPTEPQHAGRDIPLPSPEHRARGLGTVLGIAVAVIFALLPFVDVDVPVILPGLLSSPGALQVLAIGLVFAGVAMSYDVVFGYTGLLSFGHALFFGVAVYGTNLLMVHAGWGFGVSALAAVLLSATTAALVGAVALRARGIAFAMVTLAFVEAFAIFLITDPLGITGGEDGLALARDGVPDLFRGVLNTRNLYWLALAFAVVTYLVVRQCTASSGGRVWQAVRENEDRVELLGIRPYPVKLLAFVVGGTLAGVGGCVYLLVVRGANPDVAGADFALALLIMVVLGGSGRLWGAALGGLIYGLLTLRLPALSTSGVLDGLPEWLENVVAEPLFVLGTLFVLLVLFVPQGIAGSVERVRAALVRRSSP